MSGLAFLLLLVALILCFTKKSKGLKITAMFAFFLFTGLTAWTVFSFISKTYSKVTDTLRPRTGNEIYNALFGMPITNCVKVLNYQDQVVPKIDYAIWLHFETCPVEFKRILSLHEFKSEIISTKNVHSLLSGTAQNWFKPETLGDSVHFFIYKKDEYGNGQFLYASLDSTRVYCEDVFD